MAQSFITNSLNHVSDAVVTSGIMAGIGYLCARAAMQISSTIDPRIGVVSGAAAGLITGFFWAERSNASSQLIGLGALAVVPFKMCQRREIPGEYKTVLAFTAATVAIYHLAGYALNRLSED
jgi:hypothetical protein